MAQFYSQELINDIAANNDIVDVVSEYVKLKRTGKNYVGLCPFHKEKTPSFTISPDKQLFYCFGCGAGGTVINFLMKVENLDFIEAIKLLAERARISLPEEDYRKYQTERTKQKDIIFEINKQTAKFFYKNLISREGEIARKYLSNRGINNNTLRKFGLGFALNSWNSLLNYLISQGFSKKDINKAGLIINKNSDRYYDRFRNRIIFPIINLRGKVVGFGGRVIDKSLPKYLNSPETIVFDKSRNLYGLNYAKNSRENELIIVEGYMDVISLHKNGIINTVASLGTAFTSNQAKIIKRYCNKAIISYDSDAAGQSATLRAIDILNKENLKINVLLLDKYKDPDEYIKAKGVEGFKKALTKSQSAIEYKINLIKLDNDINSTEGKINFLNGVSEILAKVNNSVERAVYIKKVSKETNISTDAILSQVKRLMYKNSIRTNNTIKNTITSSLNVKNNVKNVSNQRQKTKLFKAEQMLINVLFYDRSIFDSVSKLISQQDFMYDIYKKLFTIICDMRINNKNYEPVDIVSMFDEADSGTVSSVFSIDTNFDNNLKGCIQLINTIKKEKRKFEIKKSLQEGNVEKLNTLVMEYNRR